MSPSLKTTLKNLPNSPGVYMYYNKQGEIIYIGKATSLRSRVRSYFNGVHDVRIELMVSNIHRLKYQETETVLEALILESNLIKKHQPKYNIREKDDKSFCYFIVTKEEFPRILIQRKTDLGKVSAKKIYGPYVSKNHMQIALKIIRRIFPFHSLKQRTEKGCLDYQIGTCPGPFDKGISKKDYLKNIRGIEMILSGKKKNLVSQLEKEMKNSSKEEKFEKAAEARNKIFALKHIQDIALISAETHDLPSIQKQVRIEGYDISNISGKYAVGSMIVFTNGKADKSQYRRFKIKTVNGINDIDMMREVLQRRFSHQEWASPDLVILDGGKTHLNMGQKIISEFNENIPIMAVAKGPTRKNLDIFYSKNFGPFYNIIEDKKLLESIRNEAHRFAINYHRKVRGKNWLR